MNRQLAWSFTLLSLLLGCARPQQALAPADEKLVPVYSELLLASEAFKSSGSTLDSAAYQKQIQTILSRNGLTKEEFSDRLNALAQSQELFTQFQIKVSNDLEHRKSKRP